MTPGSRFHGSTKPSPSDTTDTRLWGGAGLWGMGGYPGSLTTQGRIKEDLKANATHATPTPDDCHLRSSNAVIGYHIKATDGDIGHLEDLLVDDYTWAIRYLIVDTSNWWGGQHVLVAPDWITDVRWSEAKVSVDLTRQAVKDAPRTTRRHKSIANGNRVSTSITAVVGIGPPKNRSVARQLSAPCCS